MAQGPGQGSSSNSSPEVITNAPQIISDALKTATNQPGQLNHSAGQDLAVDILQDLIVVAIPGTGAAALAGTVVGIVAGQIKKHQNDTPDQGSHQDPHQATPPPHVAVTQESHSEQQLTDEEEAERLAKQKAFNQQKGMPPAPDF